MSIKNGCHSLWFVEYYSSEGRGLCAVNRTLIHLKKTKQLWGKNINMDLSSPGPYLKMGQQQNSNSMCQTLTFSLQTSDRQWQMLPVQFSL